MDELILIKLGGSVITNKNVPFSEDLSTIKRLAKEIHEARQEKKIRLIIGHGGGSYPHTPAKEFRVNNGLIDPCHLSLSSVHVEHYRLYDFLQPQLLFLKPVECFHQV